MGKISLICKQCGGNIVLDDSHEIGTCESCFSQFVIKQDQVINKVTQNITKHVYGYEGKDVEELIIDGYSFLEQGNNDLAIKKFKKATELEPECYSAWRGYAESIPRTYANLFTLKNAYATAYQLASSEEEENDTFVSLSKNLPSSELRAIFIRAFGTSLDQKRVDLFFALSDIIGCDESEIAQLAIHLAPNDWRSYYEMAKFREIRAKWAKLEGNIFTGKRLPSAAQEVLNIFLQAYQLAKSDNDIQAQEILKNHVESLQKEEPYRVFAKALQKQMA